MSSLRNRFNNLPLGRRLSLIVLTLSIVTVSAAVYVVQRASTEALRAAGEALLLTETATAAGEIDKRLDRIETLLDLIVRTTARPAPDTAPAGPDVRSAIDQIISQESGLLFRRIVYYAPNRSIDVYNFPNPSSGLDMLSSSREAAVAVGSWYAAALAEGRAGWLGPYPSTFATPDDTAVMFVRGYPGDDDTTPVGLVWVEISLRTLEDLLRTNFTAERLATLAAPGAGVFLIDPAGARVAQLRGAGHDDAWLRQRFASAEDGRLRALDSPLPGGERGVLLASALPLSAWRMLTILPETALPRLEESTLQLVVLLAALGLVAMMLAANLFVYRTVGAPIAHLGSAAQQIGAGDMHQVIAYQDNHDEIGVMARALEEMRRDLQASYETLEHRVAERTAELDIARQAALSSAEELRAVYDASLSVVTDPRLDVLLQAFTQRILRLLNADYCGVWLLRTNEQELRLVAHTSDDAALTGALAPLGQGLVGLVAQTGRPVMVADYGTWENRLDLSNRDSVYRALCVPLSSVRRSIGAVMVGRARAGQPFDEDDQRMLILFANMVSPSVRNAQLIAQIEDARRSAEQANMVKTRFLASITHELRTPLNLIINNVDFMRIGVFGEVNAEQAERLEQTVRSAEHLLYLINDLLDASKIEAGEMKLFIQPIELHTIIEDALDSAIMLLEQSDKGARLALNVHIPDDLPEIPADARRVRQVLYNLLSNAVKFTDAGEVHFEVTVEDDFVRFSVRDTGIGIPAAEQEALFQAFARSDRVKQLGIEGTGLGLAISRYLVEAHGGALTFESTEGVGSAFSFSLPRTVEGQPRQATDTQIIAIPRY